MSVSPNILRTFCKFFFDLCKNEIQMAKKYSDEEALNEVFENLKPSSVGKSTYDKFYTYKMRYERGDLGQKATENLLNFFGFKKETVWTKDNSEPTK